MARYCCSAPALLVVCVLCGIWVNYTGEAHQGKQNNPLTSLSKHKLAGNWIQKIQFY